MNKLERRLFTTDFRAVNEEGKPSRLEGYAAVFNSASDDLGGFTEIIKPGAFTNCLSKNPDLRCMFNHDPNMLLGRTLSGTLAVEQDDKGLHYNCVPPDTQVGRDLMTLVQRGDVSQSSFGFFVREQQWYDANGKETQPWMGVRREIRAADVIDCSPVAFPAYPASSVQARSAFYFPEGHPELVKEPAPQPCEADANKEQAEQMALRIRLAKAAL